MTDEHVALAARIAEQILKPMLAPLDARLAALEDGLREVAALAAGRRAASPADPCPPRVGAALLMAWAERHGWGFALDAEGRLQATIGDDTREMPQSAILQAIATFDAEIVTILQALRTEH